MTLDFLPDTFVYPDVEPALLAREEEEMLAARRSAVADGAWGHFMQRMLRPVPAAGPGSFRGA